MEKKKGTPLPALLRGAAEGFGVMAALFVLLVLALAVLIDRGALRFEHIRVLLCASMAAAAFGSGAFCTLRRRGGVRGWQCALLAQFAFLCSLALAGAAAGGRAVDYPTLLLFAAVSFLAAMAASLAFRRKKKKKFQKNAAIRLKKK